MIQYLVMDVDGTLTDGKIYMGNDGEVFKAFSIKDGCGIKDIAIPAGIIPIIITARESNIVLLRCKELSISEVYQGIRNKFELLSNLISDFSTVAYIGDDILDLQCMVPIKKAGGIIGCPSDAADKVKNISDFIAVHKGGDGAVRDFIEWIINQDCYN